ncbi:MAG: HD domain-containing protein [Streptococcaceae bacterium]|jgi:HD superfamily phosphohydrolase|nr:HD domain-containing protein [Streptococcaceae bacterium]
MTFSEKVFRDPVHNYVHVNQRIIYQLINTREFQRLRRIKQLGTSSFTFHGAEHSRFSHSLGVYEITRKITEMFETKYPASKLKGGWLPEETLIALIAALLHDIGHGAYSHTFEHIFKTDHEHITQEIITSDTTEVGQLLRQYDTSLPEKVAAVISHDYPNPQVTSLISSQIDADRMDYLLRDAYFTGATYGNFDLTRILRVIRPHASGITFKRSGMHAVEDYLVSRYQMYMQVYFHPASRSVEVILNHLLKRAKIVFAEDFDFFQRTSPRLLPFFSNHFTLSDYLALDDSVLNTYISVWINHPDAILSDLADRFINRRIFKSIIFDDEEQLAPLLKNIEAAGFDPSYYTAIHSSFDLPYDLYRPKTINPRTQIEIIEADGTLAELSSLSPIVKALTGIKAGDKRFFFPKEMLLEQTSLFSEAIEAFQEKIKNGKLKKEL